MQKTTSSHPLVVLWLCALLLVGSYLRVHGVSEYYYNPDELSNIAIAKGATVSDVIAYSAFETHPPYPAILRHFLMQISDSPEVLRGESVFFGLLCILVYYGIGKNAGGTLAGCIAAFLVTFSYGNILQSQVVRNYTMLAFFLGCTYWCYQRLSKSQKSKYAIAYTIFGLLSLMTHYSAIFMCFSVYAVSAFFMLRDKQFSVLRLWTLANLILAAYFGYQYLTEIHHNAYEEDFAYVLALTKARDPLYKNFSNQLLLFIHFTTSYYLYPLPIRQTIFLLCIVLIYALLNHKRIFYETIFALFLGASLIISDSYPFMGGRHSIWTLPYIILPVSFFLVYVVHWVGAHIHKYFSNTLLIAFLCLSIIFCSTEEITKDLLEHPLTNAEKRQRDQFISSLTSHDVLIAAEVVALYPLSDSTIYYKNLVSAKKRSMVFYSTLGQYPYHIYAASHDKYTFRNTV